MNGLDFEVEAGQGRPAEVLGVESGARFALETWRLTGSDGDQVVADAYLAPDPGPVVIAGHGKGHSRGNQYVRGPAMLLAPRGISVVAIDAPLHGERSGGRPLPEIASADPDLLGRWVRDHRLLVDAVQHRFGLQAPIAYVGFSMGGVFGTHLVAAESRLRALVCVVAGATQVAFLEGGGADAELELRLARTDPVTAAPAVAPRPTLMVNADEDEVFPRRSALALYDAFEHPKEITFFPGRHAVWRSPRQWFRRIEGFVADALQAAP